MPIEDIDEVENFLRDISFARHAGLPSACFSECEPQSAKWERWIDTKMVFDPIIAVVFCEIICVGHRQANS